MVTGLVGTFWVVVGTGIMWSWSWLEFEIGNNTIFGALLVVGGGILLAISTKR